MTAVWAAVSLLLTPAFILRAMADRSLRALGLDGDALSDPLSYPGQLPAGSGLLVDDQFLDLEPVSGRRLPQWRVDGAHSLDYVLFRHNVAPCGSRTPVLAIGSNASPGQMRKKFNSQRVSTVLPMILTERIEGIIAGVSAHVSKPGYLPATPVIDPAGRSRLFLLMLDEAQLAALDATEPNYFRVLLPENRWPVTLGSGEALTRCHIYVSKHGYIIDRTGRAVPFLLDQRNLVAEVAKLDERVREAIGETAEALVGRATGPDGEHTRQTAQARLRDSGLIAQPDVLRELIAAQHEALTYDDLLTLEGHPEGTYTVLRSLDLHNRRGQAVVQIAEPLPTKHVLVSSVFNTQVRPALARLIANRELRGRPVAQVDQIIRNAIGVEVGEQVRLHPVKVTRWSWPDLLLGEPAYVTMRVQPADAASIERDVCLVEQLTLDLLGVSSGDEVVIEGGTADKKDIQQVRLRAVCASDSVIERRTGLHGGGLGARFPSALDALGVFPDLPWIYLDHATRTRLRLGRTKLSTVRIRASRRYQLLKEVREMTVLLALALLGVISIVDMTPQQQLSLGGLALLIIVIVFLRARSRLRRPR